jgi:hypothetical protein
VVAQRWRYQDPWLTEEDHPEEQDEHRHRPRQKRRRDELEADLELACRDLTAEQSQGMGAKECRSERPNRDGARERTALRFAEDQEKPQDAPVVLAATPERWHAETGTDADDDHRDAGNEEDRADRVDPTGCRNPMDAVIRALDVLMWARLAFS